MILTTADEQPALNYLHAAQAAWPALDMAQHFGVSVRTLQRWKAGRSFLRVMSLRSSSVCWTLAPRKLPRETSGSLTSLRGSVAFVRPSRPLAVNAFSPANGTHMPKGPTRKTIPEGTRYQRGHHESEASEVPDAMFFWGAFPASLFRLPVFQRRTR